ncbi:9020_t:CDS:2 [Paraglomus brasilianum]|uniref:9020_t:CDS:1 n=1 Tax=Paraglomus brasilianum TaxID=144538 RepID=A0A9N9GYW1_9GLOM|nr:9020_t:CDS:2 [Paraglomus brasilianum]
MTTFDALMDIAEGRLRLQQVLAEYDLENIYNADETDNASSHIDPSRLNQENIEGHTSSRLTNVKIHYLPPNSTAHLQPMAHYKRLFCRYLIRQFDEGAGARNDRFKINVKQAIEYIALAWENISADTIKNCWRHTGVLPPVCDDTNMMDIAGSEMNQENEIEMLVDSLPDENRTIMQNYIQELDAPITAEEPLSLEQIVSMVIMEDEDDSDESREEISCVQVKDAWLGLETVIRYFE